jgi:hypothetical protein
MTALRRQQTGRPIGADLRLAGLALALVLVFMASGRADSVTERVVTDPLTGLAISGYDPVTYFTDGKPLPGSADFEFRAEDVIWHFRNEGNRAAFAANVHVYRPRFGGYDPMAIGRGVATAGHPDIWAIAGNRLYLFYNEQARERFLADPDDAVRIADQKWGEVLRILAP